MSLDDLARAHAELSQRVNSLYADRAALILDARAEGHTWQQIADVLGMTPHGAIKASKMTTAD
ncbi:hypothetical protein [Microbacterium aerolatum]|nr:hypothetical protein [Microbacterium aerolatum]